MDYRRCCITVGVDLLPLEGDDFNEEDPEPVDDTVAPYLDALEEDTLQHHTSDNESDGEEEIPAANPLVRTEYEGALVVQEQQQASNENISTTAQRTENPPLSPAAQDAPDSPPPSNTSPVQPENQLGLAVRVDNKNASAGLLEG